MVSLCTPFVQNRVFQYTVNYNIIFFPNCIYNPEACSHTQKLESPDNVNKPYRGRACSQKKGEKQTENRNETEVGKQFYTVLYSYIYFGNTLQHEVSNKQ